MKRFISLILMAVLLLSAVPLALADEPDPIPVIAKEDISPTPKGLHHYMLICIDNWKADLSKPEGQFTDGLILVTVDEYAHRVMLTNFVRDMLIQRPDGKFGRINNVMSMMSPTDGKQGLQMLIDTLNSHFDLQIEKFIVVDFKQVENIVDAIGGVDIPLRSRERTRIQSFGTSLPAENPDGTTHLKGYAAVLYMRIRKVATQEYLHADGGVYADTQEMARSYRDSVVLAAIAEKLKDITYQDALKLMDVILNNLVYTNMTTDDMLNAVDLALQMRGTPVEHITMPVNNPSRQKADGTWYEISPTPENYRKENLSYCESSVNGMAVKQINYELNREKLWSFLLDSFVVVDEE
ncbi:MAG: LCP family protein [Clostridia bacterium]|nr:LCP family protein [Clostridia bacterium]